jgi:4-diphosphocytidyl-2-C-methyl-D-erythritol kinase
MYLHRDEFQRTARAPAKLNLLLEVIGGRQDGFHELESVIVPIQLGDGLSLTPTPPLADGQPGEITLDVRDYIWTGTSSHIECEIIPTGDENLVIRALELLRRRANGRSGARVTLVKRIPLAAGMGGGSSDAAAALRLSTRRTGRRIGERRALFLVTGCRHLPWPR